MARLGSFAAAQGQLRRHLIAQKAIALAIVLKFVAAGASFLVTLIIARSYGAAVSGELALFVQTLMVTAAFAVFGNDQLVVRRVASFVASGRSDLARLSVTHARKVVFFAALALGGLLVALSPWADAVGAFPALILIAALALPFQCLLMVFVGAVRGAHRVVESQWLASVQPILMFAGTVACITYWNGRPSIGLALSFLLALVLAAALAARATHRAVKGWDVADQTHPDDGKTNSFKLGLTGAVDMAVGWAVLALTGAILGAAEVGVLRVSLQFITVITMIGATLDSTLAPRLAASFSLGDLAAAGRTLNRSIAFLSVVAGVPLLLMFVFAEPLLGLMGEEFRAGAGALRILAAGHLAVIGAGASGGFLTMKGRDDISLYLAVATLALALPTLLWLAPKFGVEGAAIVMVLAWTVRSQGSHLYARLALRRAH